MRKKLILSLTFTALFIILSNVSPIFAEKKDNNLKKEAKREIKEERKELKFDLRNLAESIKNLRSSSVKLSNTEVTNTNGNNITVSKDDKSYLVNIDSGTKFLRHYWGNSSLSEISVGDKLNIIGKWIDDAKTNIQAINIRNLSETKRNGVFIGQVVSKDSGSLVIKTNNRGEQTAITTSSTKFVNRKEQTISFDDIKVNDRIRVKGVFDKTANEISATTQIKDFTLPVKSESESE